jgi:hypothetical protein
MGVTSPLVEVEPLVDEWGLVPRHPVDDIVDVFTVDEQCTVLGVKKPFINGAIEELEQRIEVPRDIQQSHRFYVNA